MSSKACAINHMASYRAAPSIDLASECAAVQHEVARKMVLNVEIVSNNYRSSIHSSVADPGFWKGEGVSVQLPIAFMQPCPFE